jgi:hypothetical protein
MQDVPKLARPGVPGPPAQGAAASEPATP